MKSNCGFSYSLPDGAVALVTGGSRGIGRAMVLRLAEIGFDIWLNYRSNDDQAEQVRVLVEEKYGRSCKLLRFDVADADEVKTQLEPLLEDEVPHMLVNNAGIICDGAMALMSYENWSSVVRTTLDGFFLVTKPVVFGMIRKRAGRIVNISSTSGQMGVPGQTNYSAAKAGLIGATKSLAVEVARRGILVNAIAPGFVDTEMSQGTTSEMMKTRVPLKRAGTVDEVSGALAYLCSDEAAYITGQVFNVNGGLYT